MTLKVGTNYCRIGKKGERNHPNFSFPVISFAFHLYKKKLAFLDFMASEGTLQHFLAQWNTHRPLIVFLLCPTGEQTFKISFCGILGLANTVGYCSKLYKEPTVSCLWKKLSFIFSHSLCTVTFPPILPLGCFLCLEVFIGTSPTRNPGHVPAKKWGVFFKLGVYLHVTYKKLYSFLYALYAISFSYMPDVISGLN